MPKKPRVKKERLTKLLEPRDVMDGAVFPYNADNKTPDDYMDGPDGLRPGEKTKPFGFLVVDLRNGIAGRIIPPKSIWEKGDWKGAKGEDYYTWIVPGEGTPGNREYRHYKLPDIIAADPTPDHPSDWPKEHRESTPTYKSAASYSSSSHSSSSGGFPLGTRFRCPGCGHYFRQDDLPGHVNATCPAIQDDPPMYIMDCECHKGDLQTASTLMPGFPTEAVKKKIKENKAAAAAAKAAAAKAKTDDPGTVPGSEKTEGGEDKDDDETGGSAQQTSAAVPAPGGPASTAAS